MKAFKNFLPDYCNVIRDGQKKNIIATKLVPGDIVIMNSGQKVPADLRVISSSNWKVDNSSLTGESEA